jgi:hypothetical protein
MQEESILISLTDYIEKSLVIGDAAVDYIKSYSRTRTSLSSALGDFQISVPSTTLDTALGIVESSVYMSADSMLLSPGYASLAAPVLAATVEEHVAKVYCNSVSLRFISDPITLRVSLSVGYDWLSTSTINATLVFTRPQTFISSSNESIRDRIVYSTNCTFGNYSTFEYTCPTGEVVVHTCPGKDKVFLSYCPEVLYHPVCGLLNNGALVADSTACVRLSYTASHVQCACSVSDSLIMATSSSRITSTASLKYRGTFEIVALGIVSSEGGIEDTNERGTVPDPEEVEEAFLGLGMLCIMWILGVGCVLYLLCSIFNDVINEGGTTYKPRRSLQVLDNVNINEKKPFIINYCNQCLPEIFQSFRARRKEKDKIFGELYRCHRYAKLFVASGSKSMEARLNNFLHLLTVWATLVFLLAIFYNLQVRYIFYN